MSEHDKATPWNIPAGLRAHEGCNCPVCNEIRRRAEQQQSKREWKRASSGNVPPLCSEAFELWIAGKSYATIGYMPGETAWHGQFTHANTGRAMAFFCETREEARILCEAMHDTGQCVAAPWSLQ